MLLFSQNYVLKVYRVDKDISQTFRIGTLVSLRGLGRSEAQAHPGVQQGSINPYMTTAVEQGSSFPLHATQKLQTGFSVEVQKAHASLTESLLENANNPSGSGWLFVERRSAFDYQLLRLHFG